MIIIRLSGGLGNQLFQYALGRALQEKTEAEVLIDNSYLLSEQPGVTKRSYLLDKYKIKLRLATNDDLRRLGVPRLEDGRLASRVKRKLIKGVDHFRPYSRRKLIVGRDSHTFDPRILQIRDNCYLAGNWASPKYFNGIRDILLKEVDLSIGFSPEAVSIIERISVPGTVSLHIRRGDHYGNKKYGVCPADYYQKALQLIRQRIGNFKLFIFSDDIEFAKQSVQSIEECEFVSRPEIKDYEELLLMAHCSHNIIANSTFSWWGAWLNNNPNKIVVAPENLRTDGIDTSDLIPPETGWLRT